jgi:hypothetical protein
MTEYNMLQAINPMSENTALAVKQICDCLGTLSSISSLKVITEAHDIISHFNIYLTHRTAIIKAELKVRFGPLIFG